MKDWLQENVSMNFIECKINPFRFPEIFNVENICMPNRTYYNREMSNGHGNIPAINNFSMNKTFICRSLL